jgi:hypothetical protein
MNCKKSDLLDVPPIEKTWAGCVNNDEPEPPGEDPTGEPGGDPTIEPEPPDDIPVEPPPPPGGGSCEAYARSPYTADLLYNDAGQGGPNSGNYDAKVTLLSPVCSNLLSSPRLASQNYRARQPQFGEPPSNTIGERTVQAQFSQADKWCSVTFNKALTAFQISGFAYNVYASENGFPAAGLIAEAEFFEVALSIRPMPDGRCVKIGGYQFATGFGSVGFGGGPQIPVQPPNPGYTVAGMATYPSKVAAYGRVYCSKIYWVPGGGGLLGQSTIDNQTKAGIIEGADVFLDSTSPLKFTIKGSLANLSAMNNSGGVGASPINPGQFLIPLFGWFLAGYPAFRLYDGFCPIAPGFGGGFEASAEFIPLDVPMFS